MTDYLQNGTVEMIPWFGNDGVDGAPNGISVPRWSLSSTHLKGAVHWEV
jgi:hypothetical protein